VYWGQIMGILDDFVNSIKKQREQFKTEQEKAAYEREAMEEAKNEGKTSEMRQPSKTIEHRGPIQEFGHRIEEQRKDFKNAQRGASTDTGPTKIIQQQPPQIPLMVSTEEHFGHMFTHSSDSPEHVWFDDSGKAVYIDDVDAFLKSGGKVAVKGITAGMDPEIYSIYTSKGGPLGQARYYKTENLVVSMVPDPFAKYR